MKMNGAYDLKAIADWSNNNNPIQAEESHINGAAQQSSSLQGFLDDLKHVGRSFAQLVALSDASSEILETLTGGSSRQSFITAVHPARDHKTCTLHVQTCLRNYLRPIVKQFHLEKLL